MKTQKVLSHKEVEDDGVSECCSICKEEMINIEEIFVGIEDDLYYCSECSDYHGIDVVKCKEINY